MIKKVGKKTKPVAKKKKPAATKKTKPTTKKKKSKDNQHDIYIIYVDEVVKNNLKKTGVQSDIGSFILSFRSRRCFYFSFSRNR